MAFGGRVALGYWLDDNHCFGTEISYFFLPNQSKRDVVSSNGSPNSPLLLIPFFNVVTGAEDSTAIASPLLQFKGRAALKLENNMQGAEWNIVSTDSPYSCGSSFVGLAGFRYWNFEEELPS